MTVSVSRPNWLRDTLRNLSQEVATDEAKVDYARGVLVGVVGAVMAVNGLRFAQAVELVRPYLPSLIAEGAIPESWIEDIFGGQSAERD